MSGEHDEVMSSTDSSTASHTVPPIAEAGSRVMRRVRKLGVRPVLIAAGLAIVVPASLARMPRGSFLSYPAHTVDQLIQEFKTDTRAHNRLKRALGHSDVKILDVMSHLHVKSLTQDHVWNVAYFHKGGRDWSYKPLRVKQGSKVFFTSDSQPLLVQACGNPLTVNFPGRKHHPRRHPMVTVHHAEARGQADRAELVAPPLTPPKPTFVSELDPGEPITPSPFTPATPTLPDVSGLPETRGVDLGAPSPSSLNSPLLLLAATHAAAPNLLPLLLPLGLLAGSGSSTNAFPVFPVPQPVPEPPFYQMGLLLGLGAIALRRRTGSKKVAAIIAGE